MQLSSIDDKQWHQALASVAMIIAACGVSPAKYGHVDDTPRKDKERNHAMHTCLAAWMLVMIIDRQL